MASLTVSPEIATKAKVLVALRYSSVDMILDHLIEAELARLGHVGILGKITLDVHPAAKGKPIRGTLTFPNGTALEISDENADELSCSFLGSHTFDGFTMECRSAARGLWRLTVTVREKGGAVFEVFQSQDDLNALESELVRRFDFHQDDVIEEDENGRVRFVQHPPMNGEAA